VSGKLCPCGKPARRKYCSDKCMDKYNRERSKERHGDDYRAKRSACDREYRRKNAAKVKANNRAYYLANRDKKIAQAAEWRRQNGDAFKAQQREYYAKNREKVRRKVKDWYKANAERAKAKVADWRKKNAAKVRANWKRSYGRRWQEIADKRSKQWYAMTPEQRQRIRCRHNQRKMEAELLLLQVAISNRTPATSDGKPPPSPPKP
jgi:hypothetical protein